jgi:hypothetical protein
MRHRIPAIALMLLVVGCGQRTAPVSGRITLDDKPLANAFVIFQPLAEPNPGPGSKGKTDANGKYSLRLMVGETSGAIPGKHKVEITAFEGDDVKQSSGPDMVARKRIVPDEYNTKSQLTFDVPAGGSSSADFKLESNPKAK